MRVQRLVILLGVLVLAVLVAPSVVDRLRSPEEGGGDSDDVRRGGPIHQMPEAELDRFLARLHREIPSLEERLKILALRRLGTPYSRDCLGEEAGLDPDPLFRADSTDCTVFILTQVAMAHAASVEDARRNMRSANYRAVETHRPVRYATRLHFTVDRLDASPYFRNITGELMSEADLEEATVTLNRRADGSRLLPLAWERDVSVSYIPAGRVTDSVLERLPEVAGVALVREKQFEMGVVAAHEGMLLDGRDFVHASSTEGRVVSVPFLEYLFPQSGEPLFDGVIFYEFR